MDNAARFTEMHRLAAREGFIDASRPDVHLGLSRSTLQRHLRKLAHEPFLEGVWVPADVKTPPDVRCRLVSTYLGEESYLTGGAGLYAAGVRDDPGDRICAVIDAARWISPNPRFHIHYANLESLQIRSWNGLDIAGVERSLRDYAAHAGYNDLVRAMVRALALRLTTLDRLRLQAPGSVRFPGSGRYRRALQELSGEVRHSSDERLGRRLLRAGGIVVASRPGPVPADGLPFAEVDFPFYDVCFGVEVDGSHHLLPAQAARDRARDRTLRREYAWTIDRYLWSDLEDDPRRFVREVRRALERRGSSAVR